MKLRQARWYSRGKHHGPEKARGIGTTTGRAAKTAPTGTLATGAGAGAETETATTGTAETGAGAGRETETAETATAAIRAGTGTKKAATRAAIEEEAVVTKCLQVDKGFDLCFFRAVAALPNKSNSTIFPNRINSLEFLSKKTQDSAAASFAGAASDFNRPISGHTHAIV